MQRSLSHSARSSIKPCLLWLPLSCPLTSLQSMHFINFLPLSHEYSRLYIFRLNNRRKNLPESSSYFSAPPSFSNFIHVDLPLKMLVCIQQTAQELKSQSQYYNTYWDGPPDPISVKYYKKTMTTRRRRMEIEMDLCATKHPIFKAFGNKMQI